MGCFLAYFGGAKDQKRRRPAKTTLPPDQVQEIYKLLRESPPKQLAQEVATNVSGHEMRDKSEQESFTGSRKTVAFDLNVMTYEMTPTAHVEAKNSVEVDEENEENKDEKERPNDEGKAAPNMGAFPLNHRYQNCVISDDADAIDGEEVEFEDCDFDEEDDEDGSGGNEEEPYESYLSLPLKVEWRSFQEVCDPELSKAVSPEREPIVLAKGSAWDRSQYIHSVLNPVENISQWKEVKNCWAATKNSMKENFGSKLETKGTFCSEPTFKIRMPPKPTVSNPSPNYTTRQETPVDASLSNWLVSSENSSIERPQESNSVGSNSSLSREERSIVVP